MPQTDQLRHRAARLLLPALVAGALASCTTPSPTTPADTGYRSVDRFGRTAINPEASLLRLGCHLVTGRGDSNSVRLMRRDGAPAIFDCPPTAAESVPAAVTDYFANLEAADGDAHASSFIVVPRWVEMCRATVPIIVAANGWDWQYEEGYSEEDNEWEDCRMEMIYFLLPWSDFPTPTRIPLIPDGSGPGTGGTTGGTANPGGQPVTLDSVRAPIAEATIAINGTLTLSSVRAYYSNSADSLRNDVAWSPTDPTIASMDDNGIFRGMRSGTTTLIGTLATGGSATVMLTVSQQCDPTNDPPQPRYDNEAAVNAWLDARCLQQFGTARATVLRSIRQEAGTFLRSFSSLTPEAAQQCTQALAAVDSLLADQEASIFIGKDSSTAPDEEKHNSQGYPGAKKMHFDPDYWNSNHGSASGRKAIFQSLMHEAIHAILGTPGDRINGDHGTDKHPDYSQYAYFKYIDVPGPNSCFQ